MAAPPGAARSTSSIQRIGFAGPHVDQLGRDQLDDLGIVDDDNTPDMRNPPAATEGLHQNELPTHHK